MDPAFNDSELLEYLRRMAEFVEISKLEGLTGVASQFGVKEDATFPALQRKIREDIRALKMSNYADSARSAFQAGSMKWAAQLLPRKGDPTRFKLSEVVDAAANNTDQALSSLPELILLEFGKELIDRAVGGGDAKLETSQYFKQEFEAQNSALIKRYPAAAWGSKTLPRTLKEYQHALSQS